MTLAKYEHLMLPGSFPDKVTLNIDFIDFFYPDFFYQKSVGKILQKHLLSIKIFDISFIVDTFLKVSTKVSLGFFAKLIFQEKLF